MRVATLHVSNTTGNRWPETYREGERASFTEAHTDLDAWGRALIQRYNDGLRPGEYVRTLERVVVTVEADPATREHDWTKTSLVTVEERGQYFDRMRCKRCGVTGKRFGLDYVKRDSIYRAKKFEKCS